MNDENPIEEIWRIRDELGAEHGYDVDRLFDAMEREQQNYADRLVQWMPRGKAQESAGVLREEPPKAG